MSSLGLGGVDSVNEDHDIDAHKDKDESQFDDQLHDKLGLHNSKHEHMIHERSIGEYKLVIWYLSDGDIMFCTLITALW